MTGARGVVLEERVQALWGGYGEIRRVSLLGDPVSSVIAKYVVPPSGGDDPAEARSHLRKLRSYRVECAFYQLYAVRCGAGCRVPNAFYARSEGNETLIVLEDLDAAGFAQRRSRVSGSEVRACLRWLAAFHATFLGQSADSLWKVGTYWHLATRPDELQAMRDRELQRAAPALDERLNKTRFKTLVHGDAKLQNFCFAQSSDAVAAVDFQYVGGGVGVKDVAYFLSSCLSPSELTRDAQSYLDDYFRELAEAVARTGTSTDARELEAEWRALYPVACADFYRFLLGWAGEGGSRDAYLERVTSDVLRALQR